MRSAGRLRALLLGVVLALAAACPFARVWYVDRLLFDPSRTIAHTPASYGAPFEPLSIATGDGERLAGWWIGARPGPPVAHLLYLHGAGGNLGDRAHFLALLSGEGLDVLAIDYRGYGTSTGKPSERGTYADARAARAALLARDGVDPERVVYLGESLGAAIAIELSVEAPPRALVLQSTFTSIRDLAAIHFPHVPTILVPDLYPSASRIGRIAVPLLYVHGADDRFVPLHQGTALHDRAAGPKELRIFPGVGHADFVPNAGRSFAKLAGEWIRGRLGEPATRS